MSPQDPLLHAISSNDVPALRALLEPQDRTLLSQLAGNGTPDTAKYLLSRYPAAFEDDSILLSKADPSSHPTQYLVCASTRQSNATLFRSLVTQHPVLLSGQTRSLPCVLGAAIEGGVKIWEVILRIDPTWKDYEFPGHHGTVLELAVEMGSKGVLEFLLKEGADVAALEATSPRRLGADDEMMVIIARERGLHGLAA